MYDRTNTGSVVPLESLYSVVGGLGLLFLVVAGSDIVLTWIPLDFGNREWEFGTVTASFNGLLSIALGLVMVQLWLSQTGRGWPLRMLAVVYLLLGVSILAAALLYWTTVPIAWGAVPDSPVKTGLLKAIIKTSVQSVAYPVAFFLLARTAFVWGGLIASRDAAVARDGAQRVGVVARG